MKVTSVEIHPEGASSPIIFSFKDPSRSQPYNVKAIFGLDADILVSRYAGSANGKSFYNFSLEKRDLIFRVELNPRPGVSESTSSLRDTLYKMISMSRTGLLTIKFLNGLTVSAVASGLISKFEAAHFTKTPEVQITIQCLDPMLRSPNKVNIVVDELDPAETTFSDTVSTAPHGFRFQMEILDDLESFKISDGTASFEVVPTNGFSNGDILHFSSEHNNKYIRVNRGENTIHLADKVLSDSVWPVIFPGENTFECENPTKMEWVEISHYLSYWGI